MADLRGTYWPLFVVIAVLLACGAAAKVQPVSVQAQSVTVRKSDPPPEAKEVGPIESEHGNGCGLYGKKGTYEGAMNGLKEKAAARGADFVSLISVTEPHSEHGCFDQRFVLRGMAYKLPIVGTGKGELGAVPAPNPPSATPAPTPPSATPPARGCNPPCSPGYQCTEDKCLPLCNPPCTEGNVCRNDRTCGPAEAQPVPPT
jgi:Domain of unknown function (DUF4156)